MAGFQQAANAIVGAPGQIMRSTGIYNELVGKNEELIKELGGKNEELEKKNKELDKKNKKINENNKTIKSQYKDLEKKNEELRYTNMQLNETINVASSISKDYYRMSKMANRFYDHERARASRDIMLDVVYGEKPATTAGPTGPKH